MFIRPEPVPIDRLLKSAEAYRAANPDSADAHYVLVRIRYLAFARSSALISFESGNAFVRLGENDLRPRDADSELSKALEEVKQGLKKIGEL